MKKRLPVDAVQGMGLLWLLSTPLIWLGSAISKMETLERYAAFWLDSGYHLFRSGYVLPLVIGFSYSGMALVLHQTEPRPSRHEWAAA